MDLLLGPADERDTNTRHTVNAEEELILRWADGCGIFGRGGEAAARGAPQAWRNDAEEWTVLLSKDVAASFALQPGCAACAFLCALPLAPYPPTSLPRSFTPRALTPRQSAAANPFGRSLPWSASVYSPRGRSKTEAALKPSPLRRPASAGPIMQRPPESPGAASSAAATPTASPSPARLPPSPLQRGAHAEPAAQLPASPLRPPLGLAPIVPKLGLGAAAAGVEEITEEGEQLGGPAGEASAAAAVAAAAAAEAELEGAMQAGALRTLYRCAAWWLLC